jgi:hypothetical protein
VDKAVTKFRKVFIAELQRLVMIEYGLTDLLSNTDTIDLNGWEAKTSKDFPVFALQFRKEPIPGADYRQFQLFRMMRMAYGIGSHPVIMNLEKRKRESKTANILGLGVVNDDGTRSIGPLNMDVIWTNAEELRGLRGLNISKQQAMLAAAEAVEAGKGLVQK